MKIGIDGRVLMDDRYSGVGEYVYNLVENLLALDKKNEYFLFYNSLKKSVNELPTFTGAQIVKKSIPNKLLNYGLFKLLDNPPIDKLMGIDLDLFLMPHINFISLPETKTKTKNILTVHDVSFLQYPEFFSGKNNIWHRALAVKKLVHKFDKVVAISENTKRDLINICQLPAEKIEVIYSGVKEIYQPAANKEVIKKDRLLPEKYILYLGTVEPRKNIHSLIRAYEIMRILRPDLADIKLVIAGGRGWKSDHVYEAIEYSQFKNDIIITGYIPTEDKLALYQLATVFVFPSFYEGFGFPPLEAMASSVPVVMSYTASLPEVAGEAALLINPDDVSELAMGLIEAITNSDWRETAIKKGREQAEKFKWQKTAEKYLELFN